MHEFLVVDSVVSQDGSLVMQWSAGDQADRKDIEGVSECEVLLVEAKDQRNVVRVPVSTARHDFLGRPVAGETRYESVISGDRSMLTEGIWEVHLGLHSGGNAVFGGSGLHDTRALVNKGALRGDGAIRALLPFRRPDGGLSVRSWARDIHAEVDSIRLDDSENVRLHVALFATSQVDGSPVLELRQRGDKNNRHVFDPESVGEGDDACSAVFVVPLKVFAESSNTKVIWDLRVEVAGVSLRLGKLLDDIHDKKTVLALPQMVTSGGAGNTSRVVVAPYYTVDCNLSIKVNP